MTRTLVLSAVVALAASSTSCSLLRHDKTATARITKPVRPMQLPEPKAPEPREFDVPPPDVEAQSLDIAQLPFPEPPNAPPYRRPVRPKTRAKEAPPEEVEPEEPKPAVAAIPPLEQILTTEQQQEYKASIDRNLGRAQHTVEVLAARKLNNEQLTYMARIKEFIQQAEEARKLDLVRAKNLAERAGVLADDLIRSVP